MRDDFHQEDNDSYSLPPRSTIHSLKGTEKSSGSKIIRIIFSSVIFIIIIALTVFFVFYDSFDFKLFTGNQDEPEIVENNTDSDIDNSTDQDKTDIEEDEIVNEGEEIIKEEEVIDASEDQLPDSNQPDPSASSDKIHIIQPGENLYRISLQYYGPGYMEELAAYNNITDIDKLTAGYKLKIPSKDLLE